MKKFAFAILASLLCCSCFSTKPQPLSVSAAYPFEGRYDSSAKIEIDEKQAEVKDGDSLWILSNHTLYNLLTSVSDAPDKIVFSGNGKAYLFTKEDSVLLGSRDAFDDEEYVWENWTIPTNGVR